MLLRLIDKKPDAAIAAEISKVASDAQGKWGIGFEADYPQSGFGIVALAPAHVNSGGAGWWATNYWSASLVATNTWQDWQNTTITDMAYVIKTGLFDREATMKITHIRPRIAGQDLPAVNIEEMATLEEARVFYEKPYSLKPGNPMILRVKPDNVGQERIGEAGYCVAKLAFLIREA